MAGEDDKKAADRTKGELLDDKPHDRSVLTCTHCDKTGHVKEECFEIIGYPEWWGEQQRGGASRGGGRSGGRNNGRSRIAPSSTARGRNAAPHANTAQAAGRTTAAAPNGMCNTSREAATAAFTARSAEDSGRTAVPNLTHEQWTNLLAMLESPPIDTLIGKSSKLLWLLDTGASHHMFGNLDCMKAVTGIEPWPICLLNGEHTQATKEGHVYLGNNMHIRNVLYVPKLQCNLIYVSQLTNDWSCFLTFTNRLCTIQDHDTKTLIGVGERHEGVYHF